jgi:ABC-2 type transport system permease protein
MSIAELRFDVTPLPSVMWKQTRAQLLSSLRIPAFSLTTILLPIMFFGAYAVSSAMVFNFGIGVAMARGQKMDLLQRATPLPSGVAIAATVVNAMVFALISLIALFAFASIAGGVSLPVGTWLTLTFRLLVGAVPLIGLGMAIGYAAGPNSAPAVTNLIYLPMSFASGLFIPVAQLPAVIQKVAPYLPTYHYGQIAWNAVGAPTESMESAVIWLGAWTVLFFALALRFIRLDQSRKFS